MLFIDAILIILKLTRLENEQVKKNAAAAKQPLGVRTVQGTGKQSKGKHIPLPKLPDAEPLYDSKAKSKGLELLETNVVSSGADVRMSAAEKAFESLMSASPATATVATPTESAIDDKQKDTGGVRRRAPRAGQA